MSKTFSGSVAFSTIVPLKPWNREPDDYVAEIEAKIIAHIEGAGNGQGHEEEAGYLKVLLVQKVEARTNEVSLFEVCNCHSQFLSDVFGMVMESDDDVKAQIGVDPTWSGLLVIEKAQVKTEDADTLLLAQAIETVCATFCADGIIVAAKETLGQLTSARLKRLGFEDVPNVGLAGTNPGFVIRDNTLAHLDVDEDDE